jgi:hypothetical protein
MSQQSDNKQQHTNLLDHIQKYGTLIGIICIAYLQTLFPSKLDFEKMTDKFNVIEKKVTELNFLQLNLTQQQVKLADIEIRLRQLELEIVKVKASVDVAKRN